LGGGCGFVEDAPYFRIDQHWQATLAAALAKRQNKKGDIELLSKHLATSNRADDTRKKPKEDEAPGHKQDANHEQASASASTVPGAKSPFCIDCGR